MDSFEGIGGLRDSIGDHVSESVAIFDKIATDRTLIDGKLVGIRPLTLDDAGPLDFVINGEGNQYIHLPSTRLYVKTEIRNADGTPTTTADNVSLVNNFGPSLFSSIDVQINSQDVSVISATHAQYKSYFQSIFSYGSDPMLTSLTNSIWTKDVAGQFDNFKTGTDADDATTYGQHGYISRKNFACPTKAFDMYFPLSCDFFGIDKLFPNDAPLKVRLTRNQPDSFSLLSSDKTKTFKVKFLDVMLFVRKIELSQTILKHHQQLFKRSEPAKYHIPRTRIEVFPFPEGLPHIVLPNIFRGTVLPHNILLTMTSSSAFNGALDKNPYNLQHFSMNHCFLRVNGSQIPSTPHSPDFSNNCFSREYASIFDDAGIHFGMHTHRVTKHDYNNGSFALMFDLTADACQNAHTHQSRRGLMDCEIRFHTAPTSPITIIMMGSYDSVLTLDEKRMPALHEFIG